MSSHGSLLPTRDPEPEDGIALLPRAASPAISKQPDEAYNPSENEHVLDNPAIQGWPNHPRTLSKRPFHIFLDFLVEFLLLTTTLPFIILALIIVHYKDKLVVDSEWTRLDQVIKGVNTPHPPH